MKIKKLSWPLLIVVGVVIIGITLATVSFLSEKKQTNISLVFDIYAPIGLTFDKTDQTLLLGNEVIRSFQDEDRQLSYLNKAGTVDATPIYKGPILVGLKRADELTFWENQIKILEQSKPLNGIYIDYQGQVYFKLH